MTLQNTPKEAARHHLILGSICLLLTAISLFVVVSTNQAEPCPTGETRNFQQITLDPIYFGLGIIAFGVSAMLAFYFALELASAVRASPNHNHHR